MTMDIATLGIRVDATEARLAAVELDRLGAAGGRTATSMSAVERATKNLGGIFAGIGLASFAKDILATNREMETLRASLKSVTGSAASATAAFNSISEFAKNTPFEISGLTKTFITLQNMGIKPTQQVMEALTNQASKLGGSQETLTSIAMQLGQAHSKGKLQMEDMVVLMERGVPVMKLLGEVTGKNAAELADMSAKGTITIDMIDKLIIKMGEAASGSNAIAMETLNGKISSLSDAWHVFEDTLLNDKSEGFLKSIVADWTIDLDLLTNAIGSSAENQIAHMKDVMTFYNHLRGVIGLAPAESKGDLAKIKQLEDEITANKKVLDSEKEQNKVVQESLEIKKAKEKAAKDAAKAEEAQSKEATKAQEALNKSFASTLESLSLHNIELSKTTREHKEAELSAKGYTQAMVAQAMAIYDIGTALEAKKKLHEAEKSELDSLIDKYNQLTLSARDYKLTQLNAQGITGTDQAPIMAQFDKNTGAETAKKAQEDAKTALDAYNSSLDAANTKTQDLGSITTAIFDGALGGISLMTGALTTMTDSLAENSKAMAELNKNQLLNNSIADPKEKAANFKKYAKEEAALNAKNVQDQMTGTRQVAMAASKMFSEKSAGAKAFHALSVSIDIAQQAMRIKDMAMSAVATAKNIAEGASKLFAQSGWLGFAGVAAMLALMAGLGAMSKGGGSGSSTPPPSDTGTGTVLGDPSAVSESIGKTNELLKTIHASEYVELRGINRGVNTLKGAISTTLDHLFQAGGMANFQPIAPKAPSVLDQLNPMSGGGIGAVINTMRALATGGISIIHDFIISKIPILGSIMSSINRFFFGGKVTQSVVGQGIGTNATSLQSVIDGGNVSGYQYADIKTHTSGGLFSKSKTRYSTQYQALSSDTQKSFNDIFSSVGDTIVSIAGTLGKSIETDLMPRVMSAVIPAMRVNLMGLSGEDAAKKLNGVISAMMDTLTTSIFGDLVGKYQKLGEGMLETTVRIVSEIVAVQDALKQSGLKLLAKDVIAVSDALVQAAGGLEEFQKQFEGYYDKFYSESEKTARLNERLVGSLAEVGLKLADTRAGYRAQIDALDMTNALDQQRYSTLLELSSAADQYYASLESVRNSMKLMTQDNFKSAFDYKKYLNLASLSGIQSASDLLGLGTNTFIPTGQAAVGQLPTVSLPTASDTPISVAISAVADSNSAVVTEVRALRVEQQAQALAIAQNSADTARIMKRWDGDGMPAVRTTV